MIPEAHIESFSAGYWLAPNLTVCLYNGREAALSTPVYEALLEQVGGPLMGTVGGKHFDISPDGSMPSEYLAIPSKKKEKYAAREGDVLLLSKWSGREWVVL